MLNYGSETRIKIAQRRHSQPRIPRLRRRTPLGMALHEKSPSRAAAKGSACRRSCWLAFVGTGSVKARHRHAHEPEVHGQLAAVMIQVIQAHAADARDARERENLLPSGEQLPILVNLFVAHARQRLTRFG